MTHASRPRTALSALSRRHCLLALTSLGASPWLTACGASDGSAKVRLVNATQGVTQLSAYLDTDTLASAVTAAAASSYHGADPDTYTLGVRSTGSAVNSVEASLTLAKDSYTTVVAMGTQSSLTTTVYTESESSPSSGYAKLRLINGLQIGDAVDVYVTSTTTTALSSETAAISNVTESSTSAFRSITKGTYSLWVTGYGDKTDLRAYVASITLADQGIETLVLAPTHSAKLADIVRLPQQNAATTLANTLTRVRFVNAAAAGTAATPTVDGSAATSSAIGGYGVSSYVQLTAGTRTVAFTAGGSSVSSSLTLSAGYDMTCALVLDSAGNLAIVSLTDDNFPATSSTKSKIRLVNLASAAGSAQLTYNGGSLLSDYTAARSASSYTSFTAGEYDFVVSASGGSSLTQASYTSAAQAVYSAFAFGTSSISKFTLLQDQ